MSYTDLFTRYGQPSKEAEIHIRAWLRRPDSLNNAKDIQWMDKNAAELIAQCEALTAKMKEYRQDLAARYSQLETMAYTERVEIERYPNCGISYFVRIVRKYEDGTEVTQLSEKYEGKERHTALKRFEEIKKQRPGIEAIKDIAKRSWEK